MLISLFESYTLFSHELPSLYLHLQIFPVYYLCVCQKLYLVSVLLRAVSDLSKACINLSFSDIERVSKSLLCQLLKVVFYFHSGPHLNKFTRVCVGGILHFLKLTQYPSNTCLFCAWQILSVASETALSAEISVKLYKNHQSHSLWICEKELLWNQLGQCFIDVLLTHHAMYSSIDFHQF